MSEQVADDLANGREYIEVHGWTKHELVDPDGTVCAIGGIILGMGLDVLNKPCENPRVLAAARALVRTLSVPASMFRINPVSAVTDWNDDGVETVQEVLDLFAKAEKIERNEGVDPDA
jgi:hypothetical protein